MRSPVRLVRAAVGKLRKGLPSTTVSRKLKEIAGIDNLARRISELDLLRNSLYRRGKPTLFSSRHRIRVNHALAEAYHASARKQDSARDTMKDYVLAATHYHQAGKPEIAHETIGELLSRLETLQKGVLGRATGQHHFIDIENAVKTIPGAKKTYGQRLINLKEKADY